MNFLLEGQCMYFWSTTLMCLFYVYMFLKLISSNVIRKNCVYKNKWNIVCKFYFCRLMCYYVCWRVFLNSRDPHFLDKIWNSSPVYDSSVCTCYVWHVYCSDDIILYKPILYKTTSINISNWHISFISPSWFPHGTIHLFHSVYLSM